MMLAFADTSFFIALASRRDKHHRQAVEFAGNRNEGILTTDFVLIELGNHFSRVGDRESFLSLLPDMANDKDVVIQASRDLVNQAIKLYSQRPDKAWSMTDCTSFITMQEHGITAALTTDHHFAQAGFDVLLT